MSAGADGEEGYGSGRRYSAPPKWTDAIPRTKHNDIFVNANYGATALGPLESWGPALRTYAFMVFMDTTLAAAVFWGPDKIAFYNEKLSVTIGHQHPALMGTGLWLSFPELRPLMGPKLEEMQKTGNAVDVANILFVLERNGYVEETYFTCHYLAIRGDSGNVEGVYNTVHETTAQVLLDRQRHVIDQIVAIHPLLVNDTLAEFVGALRSNPYDVPMAMIYSFDDSVQSNSPNLHLRGTIGVPDDHAIAPKEARLETSQVGLIPFFRKVQGRESLLVSTSTNAGPDGFDESFDGIDWCGWGEKPSHIVVCRLAVGDNVLGFYVQGINPRRAHDEAMEAGVLYLTRQMEAKWMASISRQEMKERQRILEQRASDSEKRLRHMAQSAPVGMVQIGLDFSIQWANDQFYEITGHDRSKPNMTDFLPALAPEEREPISQLVADTLATGGRQSREVRLARQWTPPVTEDEDAAEASAWYLGVSFPLEEDGKTKLLMGYLTDISHQKWAESIQTRNATAATLAKRRQEEFIDVTCHEMRNPLSAITQLADGIAASVDTVAKEDHVTWREIAQESANAASTILTCAAHQRRVIDDVLILSRLDSQMLSITPVMDDPRRVVAAAIQMFDGEIKLNGSDIRALWEDTARGSHIDSALLDPSRLTQCLINLLSNSVKFLAGQPERRIELRYGAQKEEPPNLQTSFGDPTWISPLTTKRPASILPDLRDDEEKLYLYFVVEDTGPGIPQEELKRLFKRFSQASEQTHISYGGTGLGLYICRQLVEKQGGRVGVASSEGQGSAFAFYIESRHITASHASPKRSAMSHTRSKSGETSAPRPELSNSEPSSSPSKSPSKPALVNNAAIPHRPGEAPAPCNVLLVEDNLINQRVLASQLRKQHCTVTVANHGAEALEILKKTYAGSESARPEFDVVLMDIEMPVMNGLQCSKHIRDSISTQLPILAVTANVRQGQKDVALEAGMNGVVSKPVTVKDVLARIGEVVRRAPRDVDTNSDYRESPATSTEANTE